MSEPDLLEQVADIQRLSDAWERIRNKAAAGGSDGVSVAQFGRAAPAHLARLQRDLLAQRYALEPLREVSIPKGAGKDGHRLLKVPAVRDKVAQEAVRSLLEPRFEPLFLDCSYGYRPRKGAQRAVRRVSHWLTNLGRPWVACADIDNFFDTVNQERLVRLVEPVVQCEGITRLIRLWLQVGSITRPGRWRNSAGGIAQGSVLSPLLANMFLHQLDAWLVSAGRAHVRYADDFVLLCRTQGDATELLHATEVYLRDELGLRINPQANPVAHLAEGFVFLGIEYLGAERRLAPAKREKIERQAQALAHPGAGQDLETALLALNQAVAGWQRYYGQLISTQERASLAALISRAQVGFLREAIARRWVPNRRQAQVLAARLVPADGPAGAGSARAAAALVRAALGQEAPGAPSPRPEAPLAHPRHPPSPEALIRGRKRRYHREAADASELVITLPGSFLGKAGERLVVRRERRTVLEVPVGRLRTVTLATHGVSISSDAMVSCAARGVPVILISPIERIEAIVQSPQRGSGEAGVLQVQALAGGPLARGLAVGFAAGKVANQVRLAKSLNKYLAPRLPGFQEACAGYVADTTRLLRELRSLPLEGSLDEIRDRVMGAEGRAAAGYWGVVGRCLSPRVAFPGRLHRGARDPVNMLLNYGYAVLQSRVHLATVRAGLMPELGFLHAPQPGRPSLVLDLMEEFRPHVVDRAVLTLFSRRRPIGTAEGGGLLDRETRALLIQQIHRRLSTLVRFRDQDLTLEEIIRTQVRAVVRHLRGEGRYRPFAATW